MKTANIAKVQSPLLKGLFNSQKAPEGVNITFSMSVGQSKTKQLPREFVDEVIEEVKTEFDSLSFASVSAGKTAETKKKTLKIVETDPLIFCRAKLGIKKGLIWENQIIIIWWQQLFKRKWRIYFRRKGRN